MNSTADNGAAFDERTKRCWDQCANWREDYRRVQFLRRLFVRTARPYSTELSGKFLTFAIAWLCK
jgi:hypothetical protein